MSKHESKNPVTVPVVTEPVTVSTPAPVVAGTETKDVLPLNTPGIVAARGALVEILKPTAILRNDAAILNAEAKETYEKLNVAEVAKRYATLAFEILTAMPNLATRAKLWAGTWNVQLGLCAADIFGDDIPKDKKAIEYRGRLGSDASKYSLIFYHLPETIPAWVAGLYGVQPVTTPTLAQAYATAKARKLADSKKGLEKLAKMWARLTAQCGSLDEIVQLSEIAQADVKHRQAKGKEVATPQVTAPEVAPTPQVAVAAVA